MRKVLCSVFLWGLFFNVLMTIILLLAAVFETLFRFGTTGIYIISAIIASCCGVFVGLMGMGIDGQKYFIDNKIRASKCILLILLPFMFIFVVSLVFSVIYFNDFAKVLSQQWEHADKNGFGIFTGYGFGMLMAASVLSATGPFWFFYVMGEIFACLKSRCEKCKYLCCVHDIKGATCNYDHKEKYEYKTKSHTGTCKSGEVYDGSSKVGDVYQNYSYNSNYRRKVIIDEHDQKCVCAHCGNETIRKVYKEKKGTWERY